MPVENISIEDGYVVVQIPRGRTGRPSKQPDMNELIAYYSNHTRKETAEHFGVSPGAVAAWLGKAGVRKYVKHI